DLPIRVTRWFQSLNFSPRDVQLAIYSMIIYNYRKYNQGNAQLRLCIAFLRRNQKEIMLTSPVPFRRTSKRRGEAAEAAFLCKAACLGFEVAKPWGDSSPFDFILHTGARCWRVQVKSASEKQHRRYTVKASGDKTPYTSKNIDFLVAYIVPENLWYVLPI